MSDVPTSADVRLALVIEWLQRERGRREAHNRQLRGRGGQIVGDSHSPRLPVSVLIELERLVDAERAEYAVEQWQILAERVGRLRSRLRRILLRAQDSEWLSREWRSPEGGRGPGVWSRKARP